MLASFVVISFKLSAYVRSAFLMLGLSWRDGEVVIEDDSLAHGMRLHALRGFLVVCCFFARRFRLRCGSFVRNLCFVSVLIELDERPDASSLKFV